MCRQKRLFSMIASVLPPILNAETTPGFLGRLEAPKVIVWLVTGT